MTRHMLSFPIGSQRFNYRVAAVIIVDGHVLICDENDDGFSMLPGGRVEMGSPATCRWSARSTRRSGCPASSARWS